jgi:hypothetical protein
MRKVEMASLAISLMLTTTPTVADVTSELTHCQLEAAPAIVGLEGSRTFGSNRCSRPPACTFRYFRPVSVGWLRDPPNSWHPCQAGPGISSADDMSWMLKTAESRAWGRHCGDAISSKRLAPACA